MHHRLRTGVYPGACSTWYTGNKHCQGRGRSWVKLFVDHGELSAFGCGDGLTLACGRLWRHEAAKHLSIEGGKRAIMGLPDGYILPDNYNEACHLTGDGVVVPAVDNQHHNLKPQRHLAAPLGQFLRSLNLLGRKTFAEDGLNCPPRRLHPPRRCDSDRGGAQPASLAGQRLETFGPRQPRVR